MYTAGMKSTVETKECARGRVRSERNERSVCVCVCVQVCGSQVARRWKCNREVAEAGSDVLRSCLPRGTSRQPNT
jgi:hypothetical protein